MTEPKITEATAIAHLGMLQQIVQRMASNSASCKTWCVTIVSAILVVVADKSNVNLLWLAMLPILVFAALDVYYLGLEKSFRECYNKFARTYASGSANPADVFCMSLSRHASEHTKEAILSFSIVGFYIPLSILVVVAMFLIPEAAEVARAADG